jgi:hypothetical protein
MYVWLTATLTGFTVASQHLSRISLRDGCRCSYMRGSPNCRHNGGTVLVIFVADPRTMRVCKIYGGTI